MATSTSKDPATSPAGADTGGRLAAAAGVADLSFEQAAQELEALVEEMENNVLPLEQMLANYERGVHLAQQCTMRLSDAEKRIEIIKRMPDGQVATVPLDPETEDSTVSSSVPVSPASATSSAAARSQRSRPGSPSAPAPASASPAHDDDADDDDDNELALF